MRRSGFPLAPLAAAAGLILLALALGGCWTLSIHPLYSEEIGVRPGDLSPDLIGIWGDPEDSESETWHFSDDGQGAFHLVIRNNDRDLLTDPARDAVFEARLLRLNNQLLLDLFPAEPKNVNEYFLAHIIPAHSFLRVDLEEHVLTLRLLDQTWLEQALTAERLELPYQKVEGTLVLTADTPALQAAIAEHLNEAFVDPETRQRLE